MLQLNCKNTTIISSNSTEKLEIDEMIVEYYPTSKNITIGLLGGICYDKDK